MMKRKCEVRGSERIFLQFSLQERGYVDAVLC